MVVRSSRKLSPQPRIVANEGFATFVDGRSRKLSLLRRAFVGKRAWNCHVLIAEPTIGDGNQRVAKGAAVKVTTGRRSRDHRDTMIVVGLVSVEMAREH